MAEFRLRDSDTEPETSSDEDELQEAFAKGLLKPGLNEVIVKQKKVYVNDVDGMKVKLKELKRELPWLEVLELSTAAAPMAPDVAMQLQQTAIRRKNVQENSKGKQNYNPSEDPVLNEFRRENMIHRQAQAAVLEGIERLKRLGVPTRRPDDYFAEMAKTDGHMQKVRKNLLAKQAGQERAEKVRQLRDHKKIAKRVQIDAKLKQASEKRQMLEQLKRVRKGKSNDLDFLEDKKSQKGNNTKVSKRRAQKDTKFGFGGKKKGMKINTRESSNNMGDFNSSAKGKANFNFKNNKPNVNKKQRPGKARRKNNKR